MVEISEREFIENERQHLMTISGDLDEVADLYGLSMRAIARVCHIDPRIVRRAHEGKRVSAECERRIIYALDKIYTLSPREFENARAEGCNPLGLFDYGERDFHRFHKDGRPGKYNQPEPEAPTDADNQPTSLKNDEFKTENKFPMSI